MKILSVSQKDGIAVVQISTVPSNTLEMVTLAVALKNNLIEVNEVDEGGRVNELLVLNNSDKLVFLMDGDVLAGAKQNRVLNTSVLLAPHVKTKIPVSCVESGRWNYKRRNFQSSDYVAPKSIRTIKSLEIIDSLARKSGYRSNQRGVWDRVSVILKSERVYSKTSSLSDADEKTSKSSSTWINSFSCHPEANGVMIYENNNPFALDIFNRTDILQEYYPKLLRGLQLEMPQLRSGFHAMTDDEISNNTLNFIDKIDRVEKQKYPGVAEGFEYTYQSRTVCGFELNFQGHLVHKNAMALSE